MPKIADEIDKKLYGQGIIKVYGPYGRGTDQRKHIILYTGDNRITVSYPKYLIERKLGRRLNDNETTDHINENFRDDVEQNLQVLSREDNIRKSFLKVKEIFCLCGTKFKQKYITQQFCSNKCRHKYTVRNNQYTV